MSRSCTPYTVATKNDQVVVGLVRAEGFDAAKVTDTNGRATMITPKQIEQIRPSATSIMPVGLTGALGIDTVRDLADYFISPKQPQTGAKPQRLGWVEAPDPVQRALELAQTEPRLELVKAWDCTGLRLIRFPMKASGVRRGDLPTSTECVIEGFRGIP
jgi:hypothetical protein